MHKPITDEDIVALTPMLNTHEFYEHDAPYLLGSCFARIRDDEQVILNRDKAAIADAQTIAELRDRVKVLDEKNEVLNAEITDIYQDWGN